MKAGTLVFCIIFSILVFLILSMTAKATEYKENNTIVNAKDILEYIHTVTALIL